MNIYLLIALLCAIRSCKARPDGAPLTACSTLVPKHPGSSLQEQSPPYVVSVDKIADNKVRITISSPVGEEFEGFMLQARSAKERSEFVAGEFKSSKSSKGIDCHGLKQSTLTHVDPSPKTNVITEWTATDVNEDVVFRATVAKSYSVYWLNIDSEPIEIKTDNEMPSAGENSSGYSEYNGCFKSKGCFGMPNKCVENGNCEVLFTYETNADGDLRFAMQSSLRESEYMAMGLSDDDKMGDDYVTECIRVGSNGVKLRNSWNVGKSNTQTTEQSGNYNFTVENGVTTCVWTERSITSFNGRKYDFVNNKYHILLAKGEVENDRLRYHSSRAPSPEPVNFFANSEETVDSSTEPRQVSTNEPGEKRTAIPTSEQKEKVVPSSCSQLKSSLFSLAFFSVFYAGRRNVLSLF